MPVAQMITKSLNRLRTGRNNNNLFLNTTGLTDDRDIHAQQGMIEHMQRETKAMNKKKNANNTSCSTKKTSTTAKNRQTRQVQLRNHANTWHIMEVIEEQDLTHNHEHDEHELNITCEHAQEVKAFIPHETGSNAMYTERTHNCTNNDLRIQAAKQRARNLNPIRG